MRREVVRWRFGILVCLLLVGALVLAGCGQATPIGNQSPPRTEEPAPSPPTSPSPPRTCCRVCRTGKPCGDSCIASNKTCRTPGGCACSASILEELEGEGLAVASCGIVVVDVEAGSNDILEW